MTEQSQWERVDTATSEMIGIKSTKKLNVLWELVSSDIIMEK